MSTIIKVEHLSKAYQLGDFGTGTVSRDLERLFARIRGKEDPFLKIGEVNDRTQKGESDIVWSLSDLNFDIEQGDAVGVIGRNGAGKSTLLKVLSRVTSPTTGSIKIKGRIASLLEVGTGFHPELTGRENVFLNGAILGMRKAEIKRKFDEIIDFAGVERYIDTPVKRYSSGMYVRLAFAVAAHLESEILIVDEVLAVGDAEFQKKCIGKMGDVSKGEGRTILFVSHNMDSVRTLCNKGMVLNNGSILFNGEVDEAVNKYLRSSKEEGLITSIKGLELSPDVTLESFEVDKATVASHQDLEFILRFKSSHINHFSAAAIFIYDDLEQKVAFFDLRCKELYQLSDNNEIIEIKGTFKNLPLLPGVYKMGIHIQSNLLYKDFFDLLRFQVLQKTLADDNLPYPLSVRGKAEIDYDFSIA
ncbi:MAG: ABC transporter ATP-binding protein [Sphingobacteriales bacterium]